MTLNPILVYELVNEWTESTPQLCDDVGAKLQRFDQVRRYSSWEYRRSVRMLGVTSEDDWAEGREERE